jgi:hypothetical protein
MEDCVVALVENLVPHPIDFGRLLELDESDAVRPRKEPLIRDGMHNMLPLRRE